MKFRDRAPTLSVKLDVLNPFLHRCPSTGDLDQLNMTPSLTRASARSAIVEGHELSGALSMPRCRDDDIVC